MNKTLYNFKQNKNKRVPVASTIKTFSITMKLNYVEKDQTMPVLLWYVMSRLMWIKSIAFINDYLYFIVYSFFWLTPSHLVRTSLKRNWPLGTRLTLSCSCSHDSLFLWGWGSEQRSLVHSQSLIWCQCLKLSQAAAKVVVCFDNFLQKVPLVETEQHWCGAG